MFLSDLHYLLHRVLVISLDSFEHLCELPATVVTDTHSEGEIDGCNMDLTEEVNDDRGYSRTKVNSPVVSLYVFYINVTIIM